MGLLEQILESEQALGIEPGQPGHPGPGPGAGTSDIGDAADGAGAVPGTGSPTGDLLADLERAEQDTGIMQQTPTASPTPEPDQPTTYNWQGAAKTAIQQTLHGAGGMVGLPAERGFDASVIGAAGAAMDKYTDYGNPFRNAEIAIKNWASKAYDDDPAVQEFSRGVQANTESYFTQLLSSIGPTASGFALRYVPQVGLALATSYFYKMNKDEIYDLAIQKGADPEHAQLAAMAGGAVNSFFDMVGIEMMRGPIAKKIASKLTGFFLGGMAAGLSEGATEGLQEVIAELTASWAAKPSEQTFAEWHAAIDYADLKAKYWKAASLGAGMGVMFHTAGVAVQGGTRTKYLNGIRDDLDSGKVTLGQVQELRTKLSTDTTGILPQLDKIIAKRMVKVQGVMQQEGIGDGGTIQGPTQLATVGLDGRLDFESTEDAMAYGKAATPDQLIEVRSQLSDSLTAGVRAYAADDIDSSLQIAFRSQFLRETLEAAGYEVNQSATSTQELVPELDMPTAAVADAAAAVEGAAPTGEPLPVEGKPKPRVKPDRPPGSQGAASPTVAATTTTLYRGVSQYNEGDNYYSPDKEWARQFTQSGQDKEIKEVDVPTGAIYRSDILPKATKPEEIDGAIAAAEAQGYNAIWIDEGGNEPNSVFVIDPKADVSAPAAITGPTKLAISMEDKRLGKFSKKMHDEVAAGVASMQAKAAEYTNWKFDVGSKVHSKQTNRIYTIVARSWDKRNDRPLYLYKSGGESGTLIAERAHESLTPVEAPKAVKGITGPTKLATTGKKTPTTTKALNAKAIRKYGKTTAPESIGYITRGGIGIDSSGISLGSASQGRNIDHREIASHALSGDFAGSGTEAMRNFMDKTGNIRVINATNELNVDIPISQGRPTKKQLALVEELSTGKTIVFDLTRSDGRTVASGEGDFNKLSKTLDGILATEIESKQALEQGRLPKQLTPLVGFIKRHNLSKDEFVDARFNQNNPLYSAHRKAMDKTGVGVNKIWSDFGLKSVHDFYDKALEEHPEFRFFAGPTKLATGDKIRTTPTAKTSPGSYLLVETSDLGLTAKAKKYNTTQEFVDSVPIKTREEKRSAIKQWKKEVGYKQVDSSFDRGDSVHSPSDPESGSPLYDLMENGTYPEDVYSLEGLRYYGTGEDALDRKAYSIISDSEGLPNKAVRIYRAVEKGDPQKILPGDWVTTVRPYAKEHGEGTLKGEYKIVSKTVTARDIFTSGDSWLEYGYHPQPVIPSRVYRKDKAQLIKIYDKAQSAVAISGPTKAAAAVKVRTTPTAKPFMSMLERGIKSLKQEKAPANQWMGMINNLHVKQEEVEWVGLEGWLKEQRGKVTKQEILDFVRANNVEIEEVEKGGEGPDFNSYVAEVTDEIEKNGEYEFDSGAKLVPNEEGGIDCQEDLGYHIRSYGSLEDAIRSLSGTDVYFDQGQDAIHTKFASYQLPGGENYKELLLTLPGKSGYTVVPHPTVEGQVAIKDPGGNYILSGPDTVKPGQPLSWEKQYVAQGLRTYEKTAYTSAHWDEPNVLAHIRFNTRTGPNGERILFIEEIQSDWHQAGRKKGYRGDRPDLPNIPENHSDLVVGDDIRGWGSVKGVRESQDGKLEFNLGTMWLHQDNFTLDRVIGRNEAGVATSTPLNVQAVPNAPFKKTWPLLTIKRVVRYAAENGFDQIAWTPGEVQADRYDLSKQVSQVTYQKESDGKYTIFAYPHTGDQIERRGLDSNGIEELIGKDVAEKIVNSGKDSGKLQGLDLKVGGEGMKGFYDKILPAAINKFFNKPAWGKAKVGTTEIGAQNYEQPEDFPYGVYDIELDEIVENFATKVEADQYLSEQSGNVDYVIKYAGSATPTEVWMLPITQKMKAKALYEGMSKFASQDPALAYEGVAPRITPKQYGRNKTLVGNIKSWMREAGMSDALLAHVDLEFKQYISLSGKDFSKSYTEHGGQLDRILGATTPYLRNIEAQIRYLVELSYEATASEIRRATWEEAGHVILDLGMTAKQKASLLKHFNGNEESAMDAFVTFMEKPNKFTQHPNWIRKMFLKIRAFLQRMGKALRGKGFSRPEDYFAKMFTGYYSKPMTVAAKQRLLNYVSEQNKPAPISDADIMSGSLVSGPERQYAKSAWAKLATAAKAMTDTKAFKKWFGNSKVVGADGKPLVVYHGSDTENNYIMGQRSGGAWFIESDQEAVEYGDNVSQVYLSIKNPMVSTHRENTQLGPKRLIEKAKRLGRDGVYIPKDQAFADENVYTEAEHDVWVTLNPNQIKSIFNRGTFSPTTGNISLATAPTIAPWQHSALLTSIAAPDMPAKAQSLPTWLERRGRVKPDELKWYGVTEWLAANTDKQGTFDREAFRQYIKSQELVIIEQPPTADRGAYPEDVTGDQFEPPQFDNGTTIEPDPEYTQEQAEEFYFEDELTELVDDYLANEVDEEDADTITDRDSIPEDDMQDLRDRAMDSALNMASERAWEDAEEVYHDSNHGFNIFARGYDSGVYMNGPGDIEGDYDSYDAAVEAAHDYYNDLQEQRELQEQAAEDRQEGYLPTPENQLAFDFGQGQPDVAAVGAGILPEPAALPPGQVPSYKYPTYQLGSGSGGTDYRELLFTWPGDMESKGTWRPTYQHYGSIDPIAHVRFNTRIADNGDRVLFIEEIQSDWLQEAKEKGMRDDVATAAARKVLDKAIANTNAYRAAVYDNKGSTVERSPSFTSEERIEYDRLIDIEGAARDKWKALNDAAAPAPLLNNWHEYVFKRMLRMAAEGGYDRIGWTTGIQQIARYSDALRQQVDEIAWTKRKQTPTIPKAITGRDSYERYQQLRRLPMEDLTPGQRTELDQLIAAQRMAVPHAAAEAMVHIVASKSGTAQFDHMIPLIGTTTIGGREVSLVDIIGKKMAQQIIASSSTNGTITGDDLSIGGFGMKAFYDEKLMGFAAKYVKQWGSKVEDVKVPTADIESGISITDFRAKMEPVHSVAVTSQMRDSVLYKGQTMFATRTKPEADWVSRKLAEYRTINPGAPLPTDEDSARNAARAYAQVHNPASPEGFNMPTDGPGRYVFDLMQFKLQDRLNSLKRIQQGVELETATPLDDAHNAYQAEEVYTSKASARITLFTHDHVEPLEQLISKSGHSLEDCELYNYALHAPEANAQLRKINPGTEHNEALSGMTNEESGYILDHFKGDQYMPDIANRIHAITESTLTILESEGLMDATAVQAMRSAYAHYIPLKREGKGKSLPVIGQGFSLSSKGVKRRLTGAAGSRATNIFSNIIAQHEATLIRAEKAVVGRALYNFAKSVNAPSLWTVDAEELKPMLKQRKGDGRQLSLFTGLPKALSEVVFGRDIFYKFTDNVLVVPINGEEHTITFNDANYHAARIVHTMKNLGGRSTGAFVNIMSTVNRYLAMINTSFNPEFIISNFFRDFQMAGYTLGATKLKHTKAAVLGSVLNGHAMGGIRRMLKGNVKADDAWGQAAADYERLGGVTGWIDHHKNIEKREAKLKAHLRTLKPGVKGGARRIIRGALDLITDYNTIVENGVRLSAYYHAVNDLGMSKTKAISLAKNLTVNFTRKGDLGVYANAMYLFYNASMQGNVNVIRSIATSSTTRNMVYGTIALAAALDALNRSLGGQDDDGEDRYDKIPDYVKDHNLVLMRPWGDGDYFKIPLPWGFNVFHTLGQLIGEAIDPRGKPLDMGHMLGRMASSTISSFNPIGGDVSLGQFLSPTISDPVIQWNENKNFAGNPLRPDQPPFDVAKPNYQLYWSSCREPSKWVTKKLFELTGGDPAGIDPRGDFVVDISPELVDMLVDTATGGLGKFMSNTISVPAKAITSQPIQAKEIPFARRLYSGKSEFYTRSAYHDNLADIKYAIKQRDYWTTANDSDMIKQINKSKQAQLALVPYAQYIQKQLKFERSTVKQIEGSKRLSTSERNVQIEKVKIRMDKYMTDFNKRYMTKVKGIKDKSGAGSAKATVKPAANTAPTQTSQLSFPTRTLRDLKRLVQQQGSSSNDNNQ